MPWRDSLPEKFRSVVGSYPSYQAANLKLTERQAGVMLILYGAHAPVSPVNIGRRLGIAPSQAPAKVAPALRRLVELGVVTRTMTNRRVVTYRAVGAMLPPFEIIHEGRPALGHVVPKKRINPLS